MTHTCIPLCICITFDIVPEINNEGSLIPLLKSQILILESLRIITSSTFSNLLERYTLGESGDHTFHDLQFGFIENRGTNIAVSFTHDVINVV